jgi:choice-of-anchor A domain-containing protein
LAASGFAGAIAGGAALLAVAMGTPVAASATSGSTACLSPLAETHNFTVVVEDNAMLGAAGAGGEIEGSLAAGGNVGFGLYNLLDNSDGSPLPTVGSGLPSELSKRLYQRLDLNAGFGKIADTSDLSVTADGRLILDDANRYVKSQFGAGQHSVSDYTAPAGTFSGAFPADYFDRLRSLSTQYSDLEAGNGAAMVAATGSGELHLVLQEGKTNVWNVSAADVSAATAVTFDGATPSATTRLVINVSSGGSTDVGGLRFNGDPVSDRYFAPWVVWNFQGWENLRLVGATEMSGTLLAPDSALDYNRNNPFRGQIIAESIDITGAGEIHHWSHEAAPCGDEPFVAVTPTPTPTVTVTLPEVTVTPSPEATVTPSSEASVAPTATGLALSPEATPTPSSTSTGQQLAVTGFDRFWLITAALVLLFGGALALAMTRIRQAGRTAGKAGRH